MRSDPNVREALERSEIFGPDFLWYLALAFLQAFNAFFHFFFFLMILNIPF